MRSTIRLVKRLKNIRIGITGLFLWLAISSTPFSSLADSDAHPEFQIKDMPWIDSKQIQLDLSVSSDARLASYERFSDLNSGNLNNNFEMQINGGGYLGPTLSYEHKTLSEEYYTYIPVRVAWDTDFSNDKSLYYDWSAQMDRKINNQSKVHSLNMNAWPYTEAYFYCSEHNFFGLRTEMNAGADLSHAKDTTIEIESGLEQNIRDEYEFESYTLDFNQSVMIGQGRIYKGTYAYYAMQIVEDLKQQQRLLRDMEFKDMEALSAVIARTSRKYVFDTRIKQMNILRAIITLLREQHYIQSDDLEAFLIIQDTFNHLTTDSRLFGMRYHALVGAVIKVDNYEVKRMNEAGQLSYYNKDETMSGYGFVGGVFEYYLPLDRQWQLDIETQLRFIPRKKDNNDRRGDRQYIDASADVDLKYYYNTRWEFYIKNQTTLYCDTLPVLIDYTVNYYEWIRESYREFEAGHSISLGVQNKMNANFYVDLSFSGSLAFHKYFNYDLYYKAYQPTDHEIENLINRHPKEFGIRWGARFSIVYLLM